MDSLRGKVAVVTGAASGIGRGLVDRFASEGMDVVLADIEAGPLEEARAAVEAAGGRAIAVRTDVSKADQVDALRDAAVAAFGTVNVLCNNAGVSAGGPIWETSLEDWSWVLGVNLMGVVHGIRSFTPVLLEHGDGHVVNTASMAGLAATPMAGVYNVSKFGVVGLSETMFGDLAMAGSTVGVSVLCPGWVNTGIHRADRNRPESGASATSEPDPFSEAMQDVLGDLLATGMQPAAIAELVVEAILTRRFYILTHDDWRPMVSDRLERILADRPPATALLPGL